MSVCGQAARTPSCVLDGLGFALGMAYYKPQRLQRAALPPRFQDSSRADDSAASMLADGAASTDSTASMLQAHVQKARHNEQRISQLLNRCRAYKAAIRELQSGLAAAQQARRPRTFALDEFAIYTPTEAALQARAHALDLREARVREREAQVRHAAAEGTVSVPGPGSGPDPGSIARTEYRASRLFPCA